MEDLARDASDTVELLNIATDTLPARLQPSAVVVIRDGVSQSAGQSFAGPTQTEVAEDGVRFEWTATYTYGASVAGTKFTETFKAGQSILVDEYNNSVSADFDNKSTYDVATSTQVLSLKQMTRYDDDDDQLSLMAASARGP